jgi:hypothetical protein
MSCRGGCVSRLPLGPPRELDSELEKIASGFSV